LLPAAHAVRSGNESGYPHVKPPIHEKLAILLRDDNIVLLPPIAYNLSDRGPSNRPWKEGAVHELHAAGWQFRGRSRS
jgi:hypothetical protein